MEAGELRLWLLGPVRLTRAGVEIELGRPQRRAVLAWLALAEGRPLGVADLVDVLWPAGPPRSATNIVQTHIKHLRRILEPDRPPRATCRLLPSVGTGYRLDLDPDSVDLLRFRRLVARARAAHGSGDLAGVGRLAGEALRLWRPPLADLPDLAGHPRFAVVAAEAHLVASWRVDGSPEPPADRPVVVVAAGAPVPAQLPPDTETFIGRDEHVRWLDTIVCRSTTPRVAVVSGTAGVGKTTLAVHWAHRVAALFPDGQLYADLRSSPGEVLRTFLVALGVAPQRVPVDLAARVGLYRSLLAGRRVLVVLDNARRADQIRPLLPGTAGCVVVVTSHDDLAGLVAAGARSLGLPLPDAAEARRLLTARIDADRVAAAPGAVDGIVEACARLPLALAIVAARAVARPDLPLTELHARLRPDGPDVLSRSHRDPAPDVRDVLSWSYRELAPDAAALFRLLGVHPGPDISTDAAAALAGMPAGRVTGLLAGLANAHLVAEHRPGRFALHDLLRAHAATLTGDDERRAALDRVAGYYLRRCPADAEPAVEWFAAEHAVLLAMLDALAAHGLDRHVCALTSHLERRVDGADQVVVQRAALAAADRLGDRSVQARTHRGLARAYSRLRRHGDARRELGHALTLHAELGDDAGRAHTEMGLADSCERQGLFRDALAHAERALDLYEAAGHRPGRANALNAVGRCHALLGDHDHALTHCVRALRVYEHLGDRRGAAGTWDGIGYANQGLARYRSATRCYRRAVALFGELGDRCAEATSLTRLGDNHRAAGDVAAARRAWSAALAILTDLDHPRAEEVRARLRRCRAGAVTGVTFR